MFQVGQRVRFIRDNSDGGAAYGKKGEEVTIREFCSNLLGKVILTFDPPRHGNYHPFAYIKDLAPLTPEDPDVETDF